MRLNHFIAIGTSNRLNGLLKIVRTTRAGAGVALLSLRNCHFKSYLTTHSRTDAQRRGSNDLRSALQARRQNAVATTLPRAATSDTRKQLTEIR